jgi:hypothetical protein
VITKIRVHGPWFIEERPDFVQRECRYPENWLKMADLGGNGLRMALLLPRHLQ